MSKILLGLKPSVVKARNLTYFGCYSQSVNEFQKIINTLENELININDKLLISQWNKLIDEMKYERSLAQSMLDNLAGNFDSAKKPSKSTNSSATTDDCLNGERQRHYEEEPIQKKPKLPFGKEPFQFRAHEDDQIYNRKEKEREERQRQQREKEFQQRDAQIWPKKSSKTAKKSFQQAKPSKQKALANESIASDKRDYNKPWLVNANKKKAGEDDSKSFLKYHYPDGSGPDTDLINMLEREVIDANLSIAFDDIAELSAAKEILNQAVLLPLHMPQLFKGARRAWKGVLLFGPPGTGKTLLAKAIASTGKTTFFNVTASSLASKWKGESEKLVRILFEMAKFYSPATIFIDEIDALASKRGQKDDDSSRKVKTQLMTRIDGLSTGADDGKLIVVIGATNRPWDLDEAIRRRLEKRIYIPLPTEVGRTELIKINLKNLEIDKDVEISQIVKQTQGYSGADIANLCREAAYMPMRRKLKKQGGLGNKLADGKWKEQFQKQVNVPLNMNDFRQALKTTKPSVGKGDLKHYEEWMTEYGQKGTKV